MTRLRAVAAGLQVEIEEIRRLQSLGDWQGQAAEAMAAEIVQLDHLTQLITEELRALA